MRLSRILTYAVLLSWATVCLFPLYWLAITSIKRQPDIDGPPHYVPFLDFVPTLDSWRFILADAHENLISRFFNSLLISLSATALAVSLAAAALYGLTRCKPSFLWPVPVLGVIGFLLASRILPPVVVIIPVYALARAANMIDTRTVLILVYAAVNLPVAAWLLLPVIGSRASDQEEAAQLEGTTHLAILFGILMPMLRGGFMAVALIVFVLCWNEYLFAAYLTYDHALTLPPWMVGQLSMKEAQAGGEAEELAHLSAAVVLMAIPALVLAAFASRALAASLVRSTQA